MPVTESVDTAWYSLTLQQTAEDLQVDSTRGLSSDEAEKRRAQHGKNVLESKTAESGWQKFLRQYQDFMQILLLVAAAVSFVVTRQLSASIVMVALTIFNAVLGINQEAKAEASLGALQNMMKSIARVRRDGNVIEIDAAELVPGDVVLIEAGNRVPADGRLFVAATLEVEEAALTGESVASLKDAETLLGDNVALGDRRNMVYMNTSVTRGRGEFLVTNTGMSTEMGHIAELLNKTESDRTPLQKQLDKLVIVIALIAGVAFLAMVGLGLAQGVSFNTIFLAGVALALAAIPTGLPLVVTTLYATGTRQLAEQNAIVKRLPSVETLGSVSAICSDKTGTLTLNQMTAVEFTVPGQNHYRVTGEGYSTQGELRSAGGARIDLDPIMLPMALCADARLDGETLIGDPTEGALIVLAEKGGISVDDARLRYPRVAELPFDSAYKFMATFHRMTDEQGKEVIRCFVKGAPDILIARSAYFYLPGAAPVATEERHRVLALQENNRMAGEGERVMIIGRRDFDPATFDPNANLIDLVDDLTLLAMVGIVDPPRPEAKVAIAQCLEAGIAVRMITGDHAVTAAAIGKQLGIEGVALTGAEFSAMSDDELLHKMPELGVVARVAPEDKIRLVELLQRQQNIVAMTGDGVNDAPALKKADIGVAMGITGTEVSKDAAVMILTDDNFATIVKAVATGRAVYENLVKYITFQMITLVGFIVAFLGAALFAIADGMPFGTLVILAVNFFCHAPISIALGMDAPEPGLMQRKPRPLAQPVLSRAQWMHVALIGILMAIVTLVPQYLYRNESAQVVNAVGFVTFAMASLATGLSSRSATTSALRSDILGTGQQVWLFLMPVIVAFLMVHIGVLQRIFRLADLTAEQWGVALVMGLVVLAVEEIYRFFKRQAEKPEHANKAATADPAIA